MKASTSTVLSALFLLVACESDDPAASTPDDGGISPIDAGVDRGAPNIDDAGTDALDSGPTRGPVTISVRDLSGPVVAVQVMIQEAGRPLAAAITAANGEVVRDVGKGAIVHVVFPAARQIETVTGVEPGDRIELRVPANKPPNMDLSVTLAAFPVDGGNFSYQTRTGGTAFATPPGTNSVTLAPWKDADGANVDLLFAAATTNPNAWATKTGIPVAASGTVTVAANDWAPAAAIAQFVTTGGTLAGTTGTYKGVSFARNGREYISYVSSVVGSGAAPALDFVRPPATFTPLARHRVSNDGGIFPSNFTSSRVVQEPIGTGNFTQDLSALLPAITAASSAGTFAAPTVTFTAGGAMPASSIADVHLEAAFDGAEPLRWYVRTASGAATTITLPTLPDEVIQAVGTGAAASWKLLDVAVVESPQLDAKTARGVPIDVGSETTVVLPKAGNVVIRQSAFGQLTAI